MGVYAQKILLKAAADKLVALTQVQVKAHQREGYRVKAHVRGGPKRTVRLYHGTTKAAAEHIKRSGAFTASSYDETNSTLTVSYKQAKNFADDADFSGHGAVIAFDVPEDQLDEYLFPAYEWWGEGDQANTYAMRKPLPKAFIARDEVAVPTLSYPHASYGELGAKGKLAVDNLKTKYGITDTSLDLAVLKNWKEHPAEAKAGAEWYKEDARTFMDSMAAKYNVPLEVVVGVTAATSPRARWTKTDGSPGANQKATDAILANRERMVSGEWAKMSDAEVVAHLPHFIMNQFTEDGVAVARGKSPKEYVTGVKRLAFYNDLANPDNGFDAPVDTYMSRIAGYGASKGNGPNGMLAGSQVLPTLVANPRVTNGGVGHVLVGDSLRRVAKMLGLTPAQVQAGWWVVEKKFHPTYGGGAAGHGH